MPQLIKTLIFKSTLSRIQVPPPHALISLIFPTNIVRKIREIRAGVQRDNHATKGTSKNKVFI